MAERVVLAMSGGVDSSAAAVLLKQQGYEVIGLFMRSGATDEPETCLIKPGQLPIVSAKANRQGCCSSEDAADARRVADQLDISFHSLNFKDAFGRIKDYFADEYLAGRTPNPCVMCNNWLKFGKLWDFARQVGATKIATGHYARIVAHAASVRALIRGADANKDQSYVLFGINRDLLPNIIFPCGGLQKPQLREFAAESGLRVANKKDSYEICFVPDNDYVGWLHRNRNGIDTAGEFVDPQGNVLGTHDGFERFTIGQRKGLGITFGEPRFVTRIDADSRQVTIGQGTDLERTTLEADRLNWLIDPPTQPVRCDVQIRYRHTPHPATVTLTVDEAGREIAHVAFDQPESAIAPGQAAVFYNGDQVLGGGWIR